MINSERLLIETKGITLTPDEINVYLQENGLDPTIEYNPSLTTNKRNILKTALSILDSIANNPTAMKNYKEDDISVSQFAENLQNRIDQLERKIRQMADSDINDSSFFMLFAN